MAILWQKKHLANIPTSKTPTSANSSEWAQQDQTLAEKRCRGSIQHTGSWGTKPCSPPCLRVSLLLLGNRVSPNYPGSQLLPVSSSQHRLKHIAQYTQHTSRGHETKKSVQFQFILCMEVFLLLLILTGLGELAPLSLIPAQSRRGAPCKRTWGHGSGKHEVGRAAAERVGLVVAAVNIDAVKSERLQVGDHSSLLAIHLGLKEGIFHLALLCVRGVGEVLGAGGVPAPGGQGGVGDSEHVPPLPVRPEDTRGQKRAPEKIHFSSFGKTVPNSPEKHVTANKKAQ